MARYSTLTQQGKALFLLMEWSEQTPFINLLVLLYYNQAMNASLQYVIFLHKMFFLVLILYAVLSLPTPPQGGSRQTSATHNFILVLSDIFPLVICYSDSKGWVRPCVLKMTNCMSAFVQHMFAPLLKEQIKDTLSKNTVQGLVQQLIDRVQ